MEKKFDPATVQKAMQLANTPAGKQLIGMLQQSNPDAVQKAMQQASAGDYAQIAKTLAPLMASPEIQALMKQMGG